MKQNRTLWIVLALLVIAGIGIGIFFAMNGGDEPAGPSEEPGSSVPDPAATAGAIEPGVPLDEMDLPEVALVINGQEIGRERLLKDYSQMKVLYEEAGIDTATAEAQEFMKEALLSDLISTTLLAQEADRAGVEVDEARLDQELEAAVARFESPEAYRAMLEKVGMTEDEFREKLRRQLRIADLMKQRVDEAVDSSDGLQFTEEEKKSMYAIIDAQLGGMPSFEEIEETMDEMLEYNKVQVILGDYIQSLIESAEIDVRF